MSAQIGDTVTVIMYDPEKDAYLPKQAVVLEVSQLQGYETVRCQHYIPSLGCGWHKVIDPAKSNQKTEPKNKITNGQLAARHGISLSTLRDRWMDFVENEGYTGDGEAHETFGDYLDYVYRLRVRNSEPFDGGRGAGSMGQQID